jgi:predicted Zn-dependent peptidase
MRRLAAALLGALLLLGASGSGAPTRPSAPPFGGARPRITQSVLANGLRVVVVENHAIPLANVAMWYGFGSVNDPPGHKGLAHALEHMMFRGTRALSGAGLDLGDARLGIEANAETDYESTHYYQTVPLDALGVALRVEADRMHGLVLREHVWRLERDAVLAELSDDQSSPGSALESAVRNAAYGTSAFAHERGGTERDLLRTTANDLRAAYDAAYQPDNATLVVTGDVTPAAVQRLARALFGGLHGHAKIVRPPAAVPAAHGFTVRLGPFMQRVVDVAVAARGEGAADSAAEEVTAELLAPEHATFGDALGDDSPCASYAVDDDRNLVGGLYQILCYLKPQATPQGAIDAVRRALPRLAAHPPAEADVARARRAIVASAVFGRDALKDEADYFGGNIALLRMDPRRGEADDARVSAAEVAAVLRQWAQPVGFGIANAGRTSFTQSDKPEQRERLEHVAPPLDDTDVEPPWTRLALHVQAADAPAVDTFALPNGLRVYIEPRRGSTSVYLRAGTDPQRGMRMPNVPSMTQLQRIVDQHGIVLDDGSQMGMHANARELPAMLRIIAGMWQPSTRASRGPHPDDAWIALTGAVDPLAVRARVTALFGGWHAADASPTPAPSAVASPAPSASTGPARRGSPLSDQPLPKSNIFHIGIASVRTALVQHAPARDDPDRVAMSLANEILGGDGDLDSRLGTDVRRRRGLAYSVNSMYDADLGWFAILFDAPRKRFRAARAAVFDVMAGLKTHPFTNEELARARHKLLAAALRAEADPSGVLDRLATAARERRAPDDLQSLAARYDAVSLADVRRVAATRMTPNAMMEFDAGPVP